MRDLTPEEQDAVRHAVNDMRIEGFGISENRAAELARRALERKPPNPHGSSLAEPNLPVPPPGLVTKTSGLK